MTNAERDQRRALLELAAGRVSAARDPLRDLGTTRSLAIEGALSRIEQRLEREAARLGCATKCVKVPECEVRCEAVHE